MSTAPSNGGTDLSRNRPSVVPEIVSELGDCCEVCAAQHSAALQALQAHCSGTVLALGNRCHHRRCTMKQGASHRWQDFRDKCGRQRYTSLYIARSKRHRVDNDCTRV